MKLIIFGLLFTLMTMVYAEEYTVKKNDSLLSIAQNELGDEALWAVIAEKNELKAQTILKEGQTILLPDDEDLKTKRRFGLEIFLYFGLAVLVVWLLYYIFFRAGLWVFQMDKVEQSRLVLTSCKMSMMWMFAICSCLLIYEGDVSRANLINGVLLSLTIMTKIFFLQRDLACRMVKAISLGLVITIFVNLVLVSATAFFLLNFVKH